jgi:hypothetical protein
MIFACKTIYSLNCELLMDKIRFIKEIKEVVK